MKPDFNKYSDGLVPAIIQDAVSSKVLMLGYMNDEAFEKTKQEGRVVFFSRSKNRLWMKGETSGNHLTVKTILPDCDNDCILIKAIPNGPVCHTGADTCFNETNSKFSLEKLETIISERKQNPMADSYTSSLFAKGINKVAQKLGEEAVEMVIESKDDDDEKFLGEAADLVFHFLVLLQAKNFQLQDVVEVLAVRHKK
ncbi:MAG: bifunctional phosphoribosyl-AMP cyclohydrolase/phosphoribosyl-ATP diphosphatase [Chitinophagaceae bacterium]